MLENRFGALMGEDDDSSESEDGGSDEVSLPREPVKGNPVQQLQGIFASWSRAALDLIWQEQGNLEDAVSEILIHEAGHESNWAAPQNQFSSGAQAHGDTEVSIFEVHTDDDDAALARALQAEFDTQHRHADGVNKVAQDVSVANLSVVPQSHLVDEVHAGKDAVVAEALQAECEAQCCHNNDASVAKHLTASQSYPGSEDQAKGDAIMAQALQAEFEVQCCRDNNDDEVAKDALVAKDLAASQIHPVDEGQAKQDAAMAQALQAEFEAQRRHDNDDDEVAKNALVAKNLAASQRHFDEHQAKEDAVMAQNLQEEFKAQRRHHDDVLANDALVAKKLAKKLSKKVGKGAVSENMLRGDATIARMLQAEYEGEIRHAELEGGPRPPPIDWAALKAQLQEESIAGGKNSAKPCAGLPPSHSQKRTTKLPSPSSIASTMTVPAEGTLLHDLPSLCQMREDIADIDKRLEMLHGKIAASSCSKYREFVIPPIARDIQKLQSERNEASKQAVRDAFDKDGGNMMLHVHRQVDLHCLRVKEAMHAMQCIRAYCSEQKLGRIRVISGIGPLQNPKLLPLVRKTVAHDPRCKVWDTGPGHVIVEYG